MTLMYLVFGDCMAYHVQAHFSMLTFKRQMLDTDRIVMVTTHPDYYRHAHYVDVVCVDDAQIKAWQGRWGFFWRAKIKAIEHVSRLYPSDDLIYLDTDTFLFGKLDHLKKALKQNRMMMDMDEGHPSRMKSKALSMWKTIGGNTYADVMLGPKHNMWTAGVVGIPAQLMPETLRMALALCDEILDDGAERVVVEQYSLSVALHEMSQEVHTDMLQTKDIIGHYWANKKIWTEIAYDLFLKSYLTDASLEDELRMLDNIPFDRLPVYVHRSSTAEKLKRFVGTLFPDKSHRFMGH